MPLELVDTTYTPPSRLVVAVWGDEKVGKTSFTLSMPEPIVLYNFDYGYRPVISIAEGKELRVANYVIPDVFSVRAYRAIVDQFQKEWAEGMALVAPRGGSLIIDTATQLWNLVGQCMTGEIREERAEENEQRAADGKRQAQDSQLDWRKANATMDAILKRPLTIAGQDKVNVAYIQRSAPIYENGKILPGASKMQGFGATGNIAEIKLYVGREEPKDVKSKAKYFARIDYSRYLGQTIGGIKLDDPTWEKLMALVS